MAILTEKEHARQKLIHAMLFFVENTKICGKLKLFKLLAFLDFEHYKETGRTVTDQIYCALPMGPVPVRLERELKKAGKKVQDDMGEIFNIEIRPNQNNWHALKFQPRQPFNAGFFSKRELRIMEKLAAEYKETDADGIVEASHFENGPWDITYNKLNLKNKEIDLNLVLDGSADSISKDEAAERQADDEAIRKSFQI